MQKWILCLIGLVVVSQTTGYNFSEDQDDALQSMLSGRIEDENNGAKSQRSEETEEEYQQRSCSSYLDACKRLEADENQKCLIELQSYGYVDTTVHDSFIKVNGKTYYGNYVTGLQRGVNTLILDPVSCTASFYNYFDTCGVASSATDLADYIKYLHDGAIVLGVTTDEPAQNLRLALATLKNAGVSVADVPIRGKFAFVLVKGFPDKTVMSKSSSGGSTLKLNVRLEGTNENFKLVRT